MVERFNEIEGLLISVKVLLIISDDENKIDCCLKVHVRVFTYQAQSPEFDSQHRKEYEHTHIFSLVILFRFLNHRI